MRFATLDAWLAWQAGVHPRAIDLGLERVGAVARRLDLLPPPMPVISVAGTNGKGSSVALLEAMLGAAGVRTGSYTSPHLHRYNERIRRDGRPASDEEIMASFARIDAARGGTSLTYFEFGTLAALDLLRRWRVDVALLEVGLGGRLDAVNLVDADCALFTSIGLDHQAWLGDDVDRIGREKAGIARCGRPAVVAMPDPPDGLLAALAERGARILRCGRDFTVRRHAAGWDWHGPQAALRDLPPPALAGEHQIDNTAGVLMALHTLPAALRPDAAAVRRGLESVRLPGRFERVAAAGVPFELRFDVAHNADAARRLAATLAEHPVPGRTWVLLGVLADKDARAIVQALRDQVDHWLLVTPPAERALPAAALDRALADALPAAAREVSDTPAAAWRRARAALGPGDRLLCTGSFYTVAALQALVAPP